MVFLTVKESFRAASCWSLLVLKGGGGVRFFSLASTLSTSQRAFRTASRIRLAVSPSLRSAFSAPIRESFASKGGGSDPESIAVRLQYSSGRNALIDRKSTRLNSSHRTTSYAVFCLKKKKEQ